MLLWTHNCCWARLSIVGFDPYRDRVRFRVSATTYATPRVLISHACRKIRGRVITFFFDFLSQDLPIFSVS
jgi:hypothetical protein